MDGLLVSNAIPLGYAFLQEAVCLKQENAKLMIQLKTSKLFSASLSEKQPHTLISFLQFQPRCQVTRVKNGYKITSNHPEK